MAKRNKGMRILLTLGLIGAGVGAAVVLSSPANFHEAHNEEEYAKLEEIPSPIVTIVSDDEEIHDIARKVAGNHANVHVLVLGVDVYEKHVRQPDVDPDLTEERGAVFAVDKQGAFVSVWGPSKLPNRNEKVLDDIVYAVAVALGAREEAGS